MNRELIELISTIERHDAEDAEGFLKVLIGDEYDINCAYVTNTFKIFGRCDTKRKSALLLRKIYNLIKDYFIIHVHGLTNDEDGFGYYINLKGKIL